MKQYIVGIDFGHGETAAWVVPIIGVPQKAGIELNPKGESLRIHSTNKVSEKTIDSVVYKQPNGTYSLDPTSGSIMVTELKGRPNALSTEKKEAYKAYIGLVVERIIQLNGSLLTKENGEWNFRLCIAAPTQWNDEDRKQYLDFFDDALKSQCITVDWVINESDAAYFSHVSADNTKSVLVIDYGSSTIDYTVISQGKKVSDDSWSEAQLGASNIEKIILSDYIRRKGDRNIKGVRNVCIATGNSQFTTEAIRERLLYTCRKLKEKSFSESCYPSLCPLYYSFGVEIEQYDEESDPFADYLFVFSGNLEKLIGPRDEKTGEYKEGCYIWSVCQSLTNLKNRIQEKIGNTKIDKVILSGGASIMDWLKPEVRRIFGSLVSIEDNISEDSTPSYVVAKGIALYQQAQLRALDQLVSKISTMPFDELYKAADKNATAQIIKEMIDANVTNKIIEKEGITGIEMRTMYCNFIESLNTQNQVFCTKLQKWFDSILSEKIGIEIQHIIGEIFHKFININDIKVSIPVNAIDWGHTLFEKGGAFYNVFTNWIDNASGRYSFTWDKPRERKERIKIANGVKEWLQKLADEGMASYPESHLTVMVQAMKSQACDIGIDLFDKNQLFATTFKQS